MAKLCRIRLLACRFTRFCSSNTPSSTKPFGKIPGPKQLPFLGNSLEYARRGRKVLDLLQERVEKYGTIYKDKPIPGMPEMVVISNSKDVETVFRADGKYPMRPDLTIVFSELRHQLKLDNPHPILVSNGEDWYRQRQPMSQFMMVPRRIGEYHVGFNEVSQDLLENVRKLRDPQTNIVTDVLPLLNKWSFESVALFTLGKRLEALKNDASSPDCQEFIKETHRLFNVSLELAFYPVKLFRVLPSKKWRIALDSQMKSFEIVRGWIEEKRSELDTLRKEIEKGDAEMPELPDFLTFMLLSGKLSVKELTMNALDLLSAGIDTTSNTFSWCLYNLATHPEVQEKVRTEVQQTIADHDIITPEHIHNMPYLRSCIKETLRLYPIAVLTFRILAKDLVLSGYHVPAGSVTAILMTSLARSPEIFHEPDHFIPERWTKDGEHVSTTFAHVPFGFGARMCVGRRIAELELHISLVNIMRNFRLAFPEQSPMKAHFGGVGIEVERPLNLSFKDL